MSKSAKRVKVPEITREQFKDLIQDVLDIELEEPEEKRDYLDRTTNRIVEHVFGKKRKDKPTDLLKNAPKTATKNTSKTRQKKSHMPNFAKLQHEILQEPEVKREVSTVEDLTFAKLKTIANNIEDKGRRVEFLIKINDLAEANLKDVQDLIKDDLNIEDRKSKLSFNAYQKTRIVKGKDGEPVEKTSDYFKATWARRTRGINFKKLSEEGREESKRSR